MKDVVKGVKRTSAEMKDDVLSLLAGGEMSVREISDRLGYAMPPSSLRAVLQSLISQGTVEYTDGSRRSPKQKLRLRVRWAHPTFRLSSAGY